MAKSLTVRGFVRMFPNDDACLEFLFKVRYGSRFECPGCGKTRRLYKLAKRTAYSCQCGEHIYPKVGTPFSRSHIPLQKWFYAIFLFATTQHGVSANELQRQLGVRIKAATRMTYEIRKYMAFINGGRQRSTKTAARRNTPRTLGKM